MGETPRVFSTAFETYTLVRPIGEGGSGRVFAVRDTTGREFALKCLLPALATSEKRKRFKNEIEFSRSNRHRNIIKLSDIGICKWGDVETPFYVMPLYPQTLRTLLGNKIAQEKVLKYFNQIIDGVEAAHLLRVFHRDLKPENFLLEPSSDLLVVADFGIAHFEEELLVTAVETKHAERLANFLYSAPEQRAKGRAVDHRADIYALGLILNEMFTGTVPHGTGYKTISSVAPNYAYLDDVVSRMIQQFPDARYQSIEEIKKELIARQNEFVALQRLDASKQKVVATQNPEEVQPVSITSVDWDPDQMLLSITLNRAPEVGWIRRFYNPKRTSYSNGPLTHESFKFSGKMVFVQPVHQSMTQIAVNMLKQIAAATTQEFQEDRVDEAAQKDRDLRAALKRATDHLELRANVLKNLTF